MSRLVSINSNPSLRLLAPFVRVQIGEDIFETGDGWLVSANVSLGEGEKSSRCSFEIIDPEQYYAQKYFEASYEAGGLTGLGSSGGNVAGLSDFEGGDETATAKAIVKECLRQGVTDKAQIAYILATAQHESNMGAAMEEFASGAAYENRSDLGNTQPGDGVKFKGRGYVQITGRRNYQKYSELTGVDLVAEPTKAADPDVALYTLVHGMRTGGFTGKRLDEYVGGTRQDFSNARRTVNGTDRAGLIAGYAEEWLPQVDGLIGDEQPPPAPNNLSEESPPQETEDSAKGGQITISMGYNPDQLVEFAFIHTGTRHSGMAPLKTKFEGQSVRWLLTRRTKNTTYQDITLKQLAKRVADAYGLQLQTPEDGPTYEFLDQTGVSDYQLLKRECDRIGWRIYDQGPNLIVEPRANTPAGFVLEYGVNMDTFEVSDKAQNDTSGGKTASQPQAHSTTGEIKTTLSPMAGTINEKRPENKTGSGLATDGAVQVTGAAVPEVTPQTKGTTTKLDKQRRESAQRVKGFPGSAKFTTTDAALTLNPDVPFITKGHCADFLNRVWVIESVDHNYSGGNLKTTVKFYSPMKPKPGGTTGEGGSIESGPCANRIAECAEALRGTDSSGGPGNGNVACLWMTNKVLAHANVANPWNGSNYVPDAIAAMQAGAAVEVGKSNALPGDIVTTDNPGRNIGHVGVVISPGRALSNSSSRRSFVWESNLDFDGYYGVEGRVWRLKC